MEFLKHTITWLGRQVWEPVKGWVSRRSWFSKCCLLLILFLVVAGLKYPKETGEWLGSAKYYWIAIRGESGRPIPLTITQRRSLDLAINAMTSILRFKTEQLDDLSAWSIGQLLASLPRAETDQVLSNLLSVASKYSMPDQRGFKEFENDLFSQIQVTAWLAYGCAKVGKPFDDRHLEFLLNQQETQGPNPGWWSVYPCDAKRAENASTYATAWCVLSLHELVSRNLVLPSHLRLVKRSIDSGRQWLIGQRISDKVRWYDYSFRGGERMESLSVSGLVMHALHVLDPNGVQTPFNQLDAEWLRTLPSEIPSATYKEVSGLTIQLGPVLLRRDTIRHYVLPWELIATVDAYKNGNLFEKVRALKWIDHLLVKAGEFQTSVNDAYWIAAELLIALIYLDGRT